jgi:hypothetical protein
MGIKNMARFTIEIECEGKFFQDSQGALDPTPALIMVLSRYIEHTLTRWRTDAPVYDLYGNRVGFAKLVDEGNGPN